MSQLSSLDVLDCNLQELEIARGRLLSLHPLLQVLRLPSKPSTGMVSLAVGPVSSGSWVHGIGPALSAKRCSSVSMTSRPPPCLGLVDQVHASTVIASSTGQLLQCCALPFGYWQAGSCMQHPALRSAAKARAAMLACVRAESACHAGLHAPSPLALNDISLHIMFPCSMLLPITPHHKHCSCWP